MPTVSVARTVMPPLNAKMPVKILVAVSPSMIAPPRTRFRVWDYIRYGFNRAMRSKVSTTTPPLSPASALCFDTFLSGKRAGIAAEAEAVQAMARKRENCGGG